MRYETTEEVFEAIQWELTLEDVLQVVAHWVGDNRAISAELGAMLTRRAMRMVETAKNNAMRKGN